MLVFYFAFLSLFPTVNTLTEIRGIKDSLLTLEKSGVLNIYLARKMAHPVHINEALEVL